MSFISHLQDTSGNQHNIASSMAWKSTTAAATAAKTTTVSGISSIAQDTTVHVWFKYANTATNPTLNIGGSGAIPIVVIADSSVTKPTVSNGYSWPAGGVASFTLMEINANLYWVMNDASSVTDTKVAQTSSSANSDFPIIFRSTAGVADLTEGVKFSSKAKINASTGNITADSFNGVKVSSTGDNITFQIGSSQTPTTALVVPAGSFRSVHEACEKDVDTSITSGSTSTNLPTTAAVADYVDNAVSTATAGGLSYHGTASALTDITDTNYKKGWYWVADDSFSWTKTTGNVTETISVDPGDMIIAHQDKTSTVGDDLDAVQSNIVALTTAEIDADWAAA